MTTLGCLFLAVPFAFVLLWWGVYEVARRGSPTCPRCGRHYERSGEHARFCPRCGTQRPGIERPDYPNGGRGQHDLRPDDDGPHRHSNDRP
jgi:hypothetical protein